MDGSISLSAEERKALLKLFRCGDDVRASRRAHIILLLADGFAYRDIHSIAGVQFKKDQIELCFTATGRSEPVPGFACSREVYVKYEIMGMPADVQPKFTFVGGCI